jgi:hypothetical protein
MSHVITADIIGPIKQELESHPVYEAVSTLDDLKCFMEHHIYSVWDFMSLVKYIQSCVAPAGAPWIPGGDGQVRRFINALVLEEESDETNVPGEYTRHFEMYLQAMEEVGADTATAAAFVQAVNAQGIAVALERSDIPAPSRIFTESTFDIILNDKPHEVAAALALGREHIIPAMFRAILARAGISANDAPIFHYYLNRHVDLDEGSHAPMSLRLLNRLCDGDRQKTEESVEAAQKAVSARIRLWDGVLEALNKRRRAA